MKPWHLPFSLLAAIVGVACAPSHLTRALAEPAVEAQPQSRTVEYGMLQTEQTLIASDDGSFVMRPGQQFPTPYSTASCPQTPSPDTYQQALQVGARPVWVAVGYMNRPLYGLLLFCDVPIEARGPAARSHLLRVPPQYVEATEGGRMSVVYEPISAEVSVQAPRQTCTNTCAYANDNECDDGGPNSLHAICTLGTDCNDCGSRAAGSSTETTTTQTPAWMLFLSRAPFPGVSFPQTAPTAVQEVLGTTSMQATQATPTGNGAVAVQTGVGGIGAQVRLQGAELLIVQVLPGGGAAAAGLTQGDAILAVEGTTVDQLGALEQAIDSMRGPPDTQVALRVRRLASGAEEHVSVTRRPLR